jgi:hypothetical protein
VSKTEITVRFLSDHPQAAMHDWLRLLNLLEPEMWENLGVMPETIRLEVTSRWDDGLVDRLAEAMFHKTMVERTRGKCEPVPEWREAHEGVRQSWLEAARCVVDGRPVNPETGEPVA